MHNFLFYIYKILIKKLNIKKKKKKKDSVFYFISNISCSKIFQKPLNIIINIFNAIILSTFLFNF